MAQELPYQLVIQFRQSDIADEMDVAALEEALEMVLDPVHDYLDGHDAGSGTINIFIDTDDVDQALQRLLPEVRSWIEAKGKIGYRSYSDEDFTALWPSKEERFTLM